MKQKEFLLKFMQAQIIEEQRIINELLGRWVSEFPPTVCYRYGSGIIGLAVVGDLTGSIPVRVVDL